MSEEKDNTGEELTEDQKKEKQSKDKKKFEEAMKFLRAVVGGEENLRPKKKVKGDEAADLVAQLFREEKVQLQADFRSSLKELLKKYLEMETEVAKEQKKLDDLRAKKEKEFTQAVNNWKNKVEQSDIMNDNYAAILKAAFEKDPNPEKTA
jgi:hypothetical protein